MGALRSTWTDERLDDLNGKVDSGFDRVDRQFDRVDKRFEEVHGDIKDLRSGMNARFAEMDGRFDALNLTLIRCGVGLSCSIIGLIVAFVLTGH
jgi:hypothetical protein